MIINGTKCPICKELQIPKINGSHITGVCCQSCNTIFKVLHLPSTIILVKEDSYLNKKLKINPISPQSDINSTVLKSAKSETGGI